MWVTNSTITLNPGTAIGLCSPNENFWYGLALNDQAHFISIGAADELNHVAAYNTVQEQAGSGWCNRSAGLLISFAGANMSCQCTFTDWSVPAQDEPHVNFYWGATLAPVTFCNCQFHGGALQSYYPTFIKGRSPIIIVLTV